MGATSYAYDADGNMVSRTDAPGRVTDYGYDLSGRQTSASYGAGAERYEYDAAGNLVRFTSLSGRTVLYAYNELDAVVKRTADGEAEALYRYDADGRITGMADGAGETAAYEYDESGAVASVRCSDGRSDGTVTTARYDGCVRLGFPGDGPAEETKDFPCCRQTAPPFSRPSVSAVALLSKVSLYGRGCAHPPPAAGRAQRTVVAARAAVENLEQVGTVLYQLKIPPALLNELKDIGFRLLKHGCDLALALGYRACRRLRGAGSSRLSPHRKRTLCPPLVCRACFGLGGWAENPRRGGLRRRGKVVHCAFGPRGCVGFLRRSAAGNPVPCPSCSALNPALYRIIARG